MIETIKQKFRGQKNQHRRYVITTGDKSSTNMIIDLESKISDAYSGDKERIGTRDVFLIKRARAVHQPLWTAPFTCLLSAAHAVNALTRQPNLRPSTLYGNTFKYPHVIITNGPATGFIIGAVAHLLKILHLAPPNRLKIVYIESWAKTKTLSLTGKLFYWAGIANMFCVQHETLAQRVPGAQYVGTVTARTTPAG
jgi:beta-1,4-N-acetylglucosaminyltransferase